MSRAHARLNNFHGTKRQLVGHQVQPAWKPNAAAANKAAQQAEASGSKILLSRLPMDVSEKEVENTMFLNSVSELFRKTVGPVKECFLVYNNQGKSKGMAVVWFAKATDAGTAKAKYDGKIIDGRKPLKIEIVVNNVPPTSTSSAPLTLLQRLGGPTPGNSTQASAPQRPLPKATLPKNKQAQPKAPAAPRPNAVAPAVPVRSRQRVKKGPKRLQKRPLTAAELDQQMEEYQQQALQEIEMGGA